jgi:hypothetical protein
MTAGNGFSLSFQDEKKINLMVSTFRSTLIEKEPAAGHTGE